MLFILLSMFVLCLRLYETIGKIRDGRTTDDGQRRRSDDGDGRRRTTTTTTATDDGRMMHGRRRTFSNVLVMFWQHVSDAFESFYFFVSNGLVMC